MKKIFWCKNCLNMSTRPRITFDEKGWCNACVWMEEKKSFDWGKREDELIKLFSKYKSKNNEFDCVVPVSGGKDSTWQLMKALEYGLKPLCVNSRTCDLSPLGRKNLDNIRALGADLIEVAPNSIVRKQLNKIGLLEVGDISWPEHVAIFTIPFNIAIQETQLCFC